MSRRLDPTDILDELSELASPVSSDVDGGKQAATETGDGDTEGLAASRIEVAGIGMQLDTIVDEFTGKVWTIPNGKFDENVFHTSPYDIPNKDPRFHYQAVRVGGLYDELGEAQSQGFVPVTRRETGVNRIYDPSAPQPMDTYHTIGGDQVLVKMPKVLADRRYATAKKLCDDAVAVTEVRPPKAEFSEVDGEPTIYRTSDEGKAFRSDSGKVFTKDGSRIS